MFLRCASSKCLSRFDGIINSRKLHGVVGDIIPPSTVMGLQHLNDGRLNKGLGFTLKERQLLGIHGLLAPNFKTQDEQMIKCKLNLEKYSDILHKYIYLLGLQDRNQSLFYKLVTENPDVLMLFLSPKTMTKACEEFGFLAMHYTGMYLSIHDKGHCFDVLKNWPEHDVRVIVVTDGECVLGLGDIGSFGMCMPHGKVTKLTALAGIKPHNCLPVLLDMGTNNKCVRENEFYTGLREERIKGEEYQSFIEEFLEAVRQRFGADTLIQFEDMSLENSYGFLTKYRDKYCVFNDDIQGTASAVLSGIIASERLTHKKLSDNIFLFYGTNQNVLGSADLCVAAMMAEGLTERDAYGRIWLHESRGPITRCCKDEHKARYAKDHTLTTTLEEFIYEVKPSVLIGATDDKSEIFAPKILHVMAQINEHPVIVCLTSSQEEASCIEMMTKRCTEGRSLLLCTHPAGDPANEILSLGSHALISPGIALGAMSMQLHHMPQEIFLVAAKAMADMVTDEDLNAGYLQPITIDFREAALKIATSIAEYAYSHGLANAYPEPNDKQIFIKRQQYSYEYTTALPVIYPWPQKPFSVPTNKDCV